MTRRAVIGALLAVPLAGGCSAGRDPAAVQLRLDRAWGRQLDVDPGRGLDYLVDRMRILGDTLLIAEGTGTNRGARLVALDAASGQTRWTIAADVPFTAPTVGEVMACICGPWRFTAFDEKLQNPVMKAVGDVLPVSYVSGSEARSASGVIGVSLKTGQPVWGFAAMPEPSPNRTLVTAVSESVVCVAVTPAFGPRWPNDAEPVTTFALDAQTGAALWSQPDLIALAGDGDALVAVQRTPRAGDVAAWLPRVLDARTAEPRWAGQQGLDGAHEHVATAGGYSVLWPARPKMEGYMIIQLSTGRQINYDQVHMPMPVACDQPMLVWDTGADYWSRGPNGFLTLQLPDGQPKHGFHRPTNLDFVAEVGIGPYIWGTLQKTRSASREQMRFNGVVAIDRSGAPRSPNLKGVFISVTDRWLVIIEPGGYAVYQITTH